MHTARTTDVELLALADHDGTSRTCCRARTDGG
jgi:hypothetical protein